MAQCRAQSKAHRSGVYGPSPKPNPDPDPNPNPNPNQANPTRAALELEANVTVTAHQLLAELVAQLPCERTLFLGYEALVALPQLHVGVLAAFLGVSPKDDRLSECGLVRSPRAPRAPTWRPQWQENGTLPGEAVPCESIPEENLAFGERLLTVDAPLRLQPPCASKSACEAQVFDFFAAAFEPHWRSFVETGAAPRRVPYEGHCFSTALATTLHLLSTQPTPKPTPPTPTPTPTPPTPSHHRRGPSRP